MRKFTPIKTLLIDAGITKWKFAAIFALSFAAPFMLLLYSPLDIYLHNPAVFLISWRLLLPPLLVFFIITFILLFITLLLLCHKKLLPGVSVFILGTALALIARFAFNMFVYVYLYIIAALVIAAIVFILLKTLLKDNAASDIILLGILGVLLSAYVQTLFLNAAMTDIGASPDYSALSVSNMVNLLIWLIASLLPIVLWVTVRAARKIFMFEKAIAFIAAIITGMQIVGLGTTAISAELPRGIEDQPPKYVSFYYALRFSEEENILVFILDKLDVKFMRQAFEEHPYLKDTLYGFTHYENNVSEFFDTLPSVVSMLTQAYYREGMTIGEYWEYAWEGHNVIDTLREHGFTTNLYLDHWSTISSLDDISHRTDNLRELPDGFQVSINTNSFASIITRMSLGRVFPYLLKNYVLAPITLDFGHHLYTFAHGAFDMPDFQLPSVGSHHDGLFLDFIRENEFTADIDSSVLTLIHLNGAHAGLSEVANIPSVVQNFEILELFFDNMRELGVFDDSTIIIVGDHGRAWDLTWVDDYRRTWETPVATSLFIKPPGGSGELVTDRDTEMSNKFFAASLLHSAGLPHTHLGISYFDIIGGQTAPTRIKYSLSPWWIEFNAHGEQGYMTLLGFYEIRGYAGDGGNWVFVPNVE
ncbi:MAG: hypothetical protein FWC20_02720 [Oscillospiraceae bacterium]|nr:hypothetical protein [Oscillospiraceae bacterium]MCL2278308.1 hypothetical protein [Oscillospiraceae bacterium]